MRKTVGVALLVLISLLFVVYAVRWVKHRMDYAVSDAVFVKADQMATLAFQVSGRVVKINKDLGDFVKAGELLAEIEPEDYKLQVEALEEKIKSLRAQRSALQLEISRVSKELSLGVESSSLAFEELAKREETLLSQKREVEAQLELLKRDRERFKELLDKGLIPQRRYEEIDTNYRVMLERKKSLRKVHRGASNCQKKGYGGRKHRKDISGKGAGASKTVGGFGWGAFRFRKAERVSPEKP